MPPEQMRGENACLGPPNETKKDRENVTRATDETRDAHTIRDLFAAETLDAFLRHRSATANAFRVCHNERPNKVNSFRSILLRVSIHLFVLLPSSDPSTSLSPIRMREWSRADEREENGSEQKK